MSHQNDVAERIQLPPQSTQNNSENLAGLTGGETCLHQQQLIASVRRHLSEIEALSKGMSDAIGKREDEISARLDSDIENELGLKERAMGAWNQHRSEHGC